MLWEDCGAEGGGGAGRVGREWEREGGEGKGMEGNGGRSEV